MVFGDLFETADEDFLLHLVGDLLAEPLADQSAGHVAFAKSGDFRGVDELANRRAIDVLDVPT